jgi:hypothetical protein
MKIFIPMILLCYSINTYAFFTDWTFGVGSISESLGQVQETTAGDTNGFDFTPFAKIQTTSPFILNHDFLFEAGTTLPRSSRDSDVTRMNYWVNFLMEYDFGIVKPHYGIGMYFTRLSMDGTPQALTNGGNNQTFATPNGSATSGNLTINLGIKLDIPQSNIDLTGQVMILNTEDSEERSVNALISLNYDMGQ